MEDSGTEGDLNCGNLALEASEDCCMWSRDRSCVILVKNVDAF